MKTKILAAAGVAAFALSASATASYAGYVQPGETMGVSLDSPLPEGVFFADLENYGRSSGSGGGVGVNIPVLLWSTPFSFYNTRLEFLAALPFAHVDDSLNRAVPILGGGGAVEPLTQTGAITFAFGPIFAHDFGNGLTGGVSAFVRTPDPSLNLRSISGRYATEGDFRESLQYTIKAPGSAFDGITLIENAGVTTGFGASQSPINENDMFQGDFAIEKTFDKFTIGFTGFGNYDITNFSATGRLRNVELGGLIGYDFGKFSLTGIVTHSLLSGGLSGTPGVTLNANPETRGWLRIVVPLYVAPTAPVVTARY